MEIIRLSDLYIQECNGCMACMLKGAPCRLQDDRNWLYERLDAAGGLVVGAPSYHGWVPGIFGTIQFRTTGYRQFSLFAPDQGRVKKAVTLSAAGGVAIAGNVIPALNVFVHRLGFEPLASFIAGSQGPGEVLLPEREAIIGEVNRLGLVLPRPRGGKAVHGGGRLPLLFRPGGGQLLLVPHQSPAPRRGGVRFLSLLPGEG